jgi:hypothetical protein
VFRLILSLTDKIGPMWVMRDIIIIFKKHHLHSKDIICKYLRLLSCCLNKAWEVKRGLLMSMSKAAEERAPYPRSDRYSADLLLSRSGCRSDRLPSELPSDNSYGQKKLFAHMS